LQDEAVVDRVFSWMGRDEPDEVQRTTAALRAVPYLQEILDAMPLPVSLLNEKGQIVLMNRWWSQSLGEEAGCALGKRHGEVLNCAHSSDGPDGCGTSRHCEQCGALVSVLESQRSQTQVTRAYQLHRETATGLQTTELSVTSTPLRVQGRKLTLFVVHAASSHPALA
jgi:PAS domain-containing protein